MKKPGIKSNVKNDLISFGILSGIVLAVLIVLYVYDQSANYFEPLAASIYDNLVR